MTSDIRMGMERPWSTAAVRIFARLTYLLIIDTLYNCNITEVTRHAKCLR